MLRRLRLLTENLRCVIVEGYDPKEDDVRTSKRFIERTLMIVADNIIRAPAVISFLHDIKIKGAGQKSAAKQRMAKALLKQIGRKEGFLRRHTDAAKFLVAFAPIAHVLAERDQHTGKSFQEDPSTRYEIFKTARRLAPEFAKDRKDDFEDLRNAMTSAINTYLKALPEADADSGADLDDEAKAEIFEEVIEQIYIDYLEGIKKRLWLDLLDYVQKNTNAS